MDSLNRKQIIGSIGPTTRQQQNRLRRHRSKESWKHEYDVHGMNSEEVNDSSDSNLEDDILNGSHFIQQNIAGHHLINRTSGPSYDDPIQHQYEEPRTVHVDGYNRKNNFAERIQTRRNPNPSSSLSNRSIGGRITGDYSSSSRERERNALFYVTATTQRNDAGQLQDDNDLDIDNLHHYSSVDPTSQSINNTTIIKPSKLFGNQFGSLTRGQRGNLRDERSPMSNSMGNSNGQSTSNQQNSTQNNNNSSNNNSNNKRHSLLHDQRDVSLSSNSDNNLDNNYIVNESQEQRQQQKVDDNLSGYSKINLDNCNSIKTLECQDNRLNNLMNNKFHGKNDAERIDNLTTNYQLYTNPFPLFSSGSSSYKNTNQSSTTGPMVPQPNSMNPSQLLQSSCSGSGAPPSLGPPPFRSSHNHSGASSHGGGGSVLASFGHVGSRLNFFSGKNYCTHQCSWRYSTITLIVVCLLLFSLVIYFGATNSMSSIQNNDNTKVPCFAVEELNELSSSSSSSSSPSSISSDFIDRTTQMPTPSCLALMPRDPIEFVELKLDNFNDNFGYFKSPDSVSGPGVGSGSEPITVVIEPYKSWSGWFNHQSNDSPLIRFNFSLQSPHHSFFSSSSSSHQFSSSNHHPSQYQLAFFARKNDPPTLTSHHMFEIISLRNQLNEKSEFELLKYFDPGAWYISLVNDNDEPVQLVLSANTARDHQKSCPNNCHHRGQCYLGKCDCLPGFYGPDCGESACPVLCSGKGRYVNGKCRCEIGWKGPECDIKTSECDSPDCSSHGQCIAGQCECSPGFSGQNCEIVDCSDPLCSNHGSCHAGQCWCKVGWTGVNCSQADGRLTKFLPNCSSHGVYDLDTSKCVCFANWFGSKCEIAKCNLDCGQHGICQGGQCQCEAGWHGIKCDQMECDVRCHQHGHGTCTNGTCVCSKGWMGKHCTLDGCPNQCSNKGDCIRGKHSTDSSSDIWSCKCKDGWGGRDCSSVQEINCSDEIDNDNDGLSDCADSECCHHDHCKDSLMCISSPDPLDILLRKQPPAVTASFYQKMKFLIEKSSVQSYAHRDEYSESQFWSAFKPSRVSVIRGQVISREGNGLIGIRVSVATDPQFGFTLTRTDGWFDILVNGGGAVTLQFQRNPFHPIKRTVFVPWNDIVVMPNPIVMSSSPSPAPSTSISSFDHDIDHLSFGDPFNTGVDVMITDKRHNHSVWHCFDHDYDVMRPILYEKLTKTKQGNCNGSSVIPETQVLQESLSILGSNLSLVYHSSYSQGYLSTINIQLTPSSVPHSLRLVHLRIIIEGILFEKTFEVDNDIQYTYAWNKRNIYKQKVYGITTAKIFVGYSYKNCYQIMWNAMTTSLKGYDMDISELGSWNLDIHHRYNFHEGILQKGDGTSIYFKQQPRVINVLMGNGQQRPLMCGQECNGHARESKLFAPVALTSGPDGSVYVGDGNLVRRITPERLVFTVFKFKNTKSPFYNYHITLNPVDGHLYISSPERHQIIRVHSLDKVDDPESNFDVVVGNGDRCYPHDQLRCGDGKPAPEARLIHPKGIAFGTDGSLYFADGNSIRMVDSHGIIHTIIGDINYKKQWKPLPCQGTISVNEVKLHWPEQVAISPLEGSLYFIDDHMLLRLTHDRRIMIVAGQPHYCRKTKRQNSGSSFTNFAFGPTGTLYVVEVTDDDNHQRVRVLNQQTGQLNDFAGKINCQTDCPDGDCVNCSSLKNQAIVEEKNVILALDTQLKSITALTVTSDDVVHIADGHNGNLKLLSTVPYIPQPDEHFQFQISSSDGHELYYFNKYGQHTMTRNKLSGKTMYTFLYNVNTSFGKLSAVTDSSGYKVSFLRGLVNNLLTIETTKGQMRILIDKQGFLEMFIDPNDFKTKFTYDSNGLLVSRSNSTGHSFVYSYDETGHFIHCKLI